MSPFSANYGIIILNARPIYGLSAICRVHIALTLRWFKWKEIKRNNERGDTFSLLFFVPELNSFDRWTFALLSLLTRLPPSLLYRFSNSDSLLWLGFFLSLSPLPSPLLLLFPILLQMNGRMKNASGVFQLNAKWIPAAAAAACLLYPWFSDSILIFWNFREYM